MKLYSLFGALSAGVILCALGGIALLIERVVT